MEVPVVEEEENGDASEAIATAITGNNLSLIETDQTTIDDEHVDNRSPFPDRPIILRSRNQVAIKEPCFEEEIIKNRGRRQMPRTPVRKSTRIESNTATISSDQPQQSPFTKCLSTIHSTPNRTDCPSPSTTTTTTRKLRSMSTIGLMKDGKIYSPNSRLLRSSVRLSESFNDSGIEMSSPSFDSSKSNTVTRTAKRKESDEIQVTPCIKRINRVRRRFRF